MRTISLSHRLTTLLVAGMLGIVGCGLLAGQAQAAVRLADWNRIQHNQLGDTYTAFNLLADWRGSRTGYGSATVTSGSAFAWNRLGGCAQVFVYGYFNGVGWRQVRAGNRASAATYVTCGRAGSTPQLAMRGAGVAGYGLRGLHVTVCYSRYASSVMTACSGATSTR